MLLNNLLHQIWFLVPACTTIFSSTSRSFILLVAEARYEPFKLVHRYSSSEASILSQVINSAIHLILNENRFTLTATVFEHQRIIMWCKITLKLQA